MSLVDYLPEIGISVLAILISYQDINERKVSVLLLIGLFLTALAGKLLVVNGYLLFENIFKNFFFLFIQIGGIYMYMIFKTGSKENPINRVIGVGDLLFWIALTPLFGVYYFILFFIGSLFFAAVVHFLILNNFFTREKYENRLIPLAGLQAIFLIIVLVINHLVWEIELHSEPDRFLFI